MDNIRVDKEMVFNINMPKSIAIGDPMYFETGEGLQYTYSKNFRRTTWVGSLKVTEEINLNLAKEFGIEITELVARVYLAPNDSFLKTYQDNMFYKGQKAKSTEIGVDTACYITDIDDRFIEVDTGSDGTMGDATEFYKGNKLEGIVITLSGSDFHEYDRFLQEMKYVWGVK